MSLTVSLVPGYQFPTDGSVALSYELLNLLGTPTVNLLGALGSLSIADGSVTTVKLANNALSADATGRGKMQDGFFAAGDAASLAKFENGFLPLIKATVTFIHEGTLKSLPVGADEILIADSAASYANKKVTLASLTPQVHYASDATYATSALSMPYDNNIPQNTDGVELVNLRVTFTPRATTSILIIEAIVNVDLPGSGIGVLALFQDSTANALAAMAMPDAGNAVQAFVLRHKMAAGTTSSTTFKLRTGPTSGTIGINGSSGAKFGGVMVSSLMITEIPA